MIVMTTYDVEEVYRLYDGILMKVGSADRAVELVRIAVDRKLREDATRALDNVAGALHNIGAQLAMMRGVG